MYVCCFTLEEEIDMLTVVSKEGSLAVVKRHHNGIVFDFQVHDLLSPHSPVVARFETQAEAEFDISAAKVQTKKKAVRKPRKKAAA